MVVVGDTELHVGQGGGGHTEQDVGEFGVLVISWAEKTIPAPPAPQGALGAGLLYYCCGVQHNKKHTDTRGQNTKKLRVLLLWNHEYCKGCFREPPESRGTWDAEFLHRVGVAGKRGVIPRSCCSCRC